MLQIKIFLESKNEKGCKWCCPWQQVLQLLFFLNENKLGWEGEGRVERNKQIHSPLGTLITAAILWIRMPPFFSWETIKIRQCVEFWKQIKQFHHHFYFPWKCLKLTMLLFWTLFQIQSLLPVRSEQRLFWIPIGFTVQHLRMFCRVWTAIWWSTYSLLWNSKHGQGRLLIKKKPKTTTCVFISCLVKTSPYNGHHFILILLLLKFVYTSVYKHL